MLANDVYWHRDSEDSGKVGQRMQEVVTRKAEEGGKECRT